MYIRKTRSQEVENIFEEFFTPPEQYLQSTLLSSRILHSHVDTM